MRAILFDFDYTLADSSAAIEACFQAGLRGIGLSPGDPEAIRRTIGLSLPDSLAQVAGERHRARADEFRKHWRALSDRIMVDQTRLFDHVPEALSGLAALEVRLGIVSTKWRNRIEDVLRRDGLLTHFDVIVGGDDVGDHKPSPEGLLAALARLEVCKEEALYVGDSVTDALTARRAEVDFVAVLSGATPRAALEEHRPRVVLEHVGELVGWLGEGA